MALPSVTATREIVKVKPQITAGFSHICYWKEAVMNFRQLSALRTLKGRFGFCFKKCLFSVTSASAPTHSVYAAMKASASFNPILSYLTPNSKGTRKSSSIEVSSEIKSKNSRNSLWPKLRLTSSAIVRGIRSWYSKGEEAHNLATDLQEAFTGGIKANMYMFVSRTRSKFLFPKLFSCFAQFLYHFFFSHALKRRLPLRHKLAKSVKMLHGAFGVGLFAFHKSSPLFHKSITWNYRKVKDTVRDFNINFRQP